jgi:hypothetical protein
MKGRVFPRARLLHQRLIIIEIHLARPEKAGGDVGQRRLQGDRPDVLVDRVGADHGQVPAAAFRGNRFGSRVSEDGLAKRLEFIGRPGDRVGRQTRGFPLAVQGLVDPLGQPVYPIAAQYGRQVDDAVRLISADFSLGNVAHEPLWGRLLIDHCFLMTSRLLFGR